MKPLKDIVRYENDHFIVDCCPRNGDMTPPSLDATVVHVYEMEVDFNLNRPRYTFCLNVAIVDDIVQRGGKMDIHCHKCNSNYEVDEGTLDYAMGLTPNKQSI